jgi:hypothetical protein
MRSAIDCACATGIGTVSNSQCRKRSPVAKAEEQQHQDQHQVHDTEQDVAGHDGADIGDLRAGHIYVAEHEFLQVELREQADLSGELAQPVPVALQESGKQAGRKGTLGRLERADPATHRRVEFRGLAHTTTPSTNSVGTSTSNSTASVLSPAATPSREGSRRCRNLWIGKQTSASEAAQMMGVREQRQDQQQLVDQEGERAKTRRTSARYALFRTRWCARRRSRASRCCAALAGSGAASSIMAIPFRRSRGTSL